MDGFPECRRNSKDRVDPGEKKSVYAKNWGTDWSGGDGKKGHGGKKHGGVKGGVVSNAAKRA